MADIFTSSRRTHPPLEQNRLATARNPGSLARSWQNSTPLHYEAAQARTGANQVAGKLARMASIPTIDSRDMFPFRIFQAPAQLTGNPNWSDDYGAAAWRTFSVWTGQATAYLNLTAGANAPNNSSVATQQSVYVARTTGYPLSGISSNTQVVSAASWLAANITNATNNASLSYSNGWSNAQISQWSIVGEDYNEFYAAQTLGLYPPNPTNPNGTGPANYALHVDNQDSTPNAAWPNNYRELAFTAPPSSVAVFWVSWDTNAQNKYIAFVNGATYAAFPVLHFGGITANPAYIAANGTPFFGDLNATNGGSIMGFLAKDYAGTPSQIYPYFPANAFAAPQSSGSQTPEGTVIIGAIQIGAMGAAASTGNDGLCQIYQAMFNNVGTMERAQFRGAYNSNTWYFPSEIVSQGNNTYIQATPLGLNNLDPTNTLSNNPVSDGTNYSTFKNLWIPLGSAGSSAPSATYNCVVIQESFNTVTCNSPNGGAIVAFVTVTNGGFGYTTVPSVSITNGGGSGARAVATINSVSNVVNGVFVEYGGTNYVSVPNLSFSGGGGTGAAANANINVGFTVAKPHTLRGFVSITNDSQGASQIISPSYLTGNNANTNSLVATTLTGGTGIANVTMQDLNENPRVLLTLLATCETINGSPTNAHRYFHCTTYNT